MLVPNQLIEVKVIGCTLQHYRNLGYNVKMFDTIEVPPEHLTCGSKAVVDVLCDVCGKKIPRQYKKYIKSHTYELDTCTQCKTKKIKQTCLDKYGVDNPMRDIEIKQKQQNVIQTKFSVDNISQLDDVKKKKMETFQEKYGVDWAIAAPEIRAKVKQTWLDKYGCENPMQNITIRNKTQQTNIEKYGVLHPAQNLQIREKIISTLCQNGNVPTSSQQLQIYQTIKQKYVNAELNYPLSRCSLDIFVCVNNVNIDIEYDCWYWHNKQKDIKRDKFIQKNGFKVLRIRSGRLIPDEQELFEAIDYLANTEHHFKEIILSDWKEVDLCQEQSQAAV